MVIEWWRSRPADLIDEGWFGRGEPDPRLIERLGDYALIGREHRVIYDRLPHQQVPHHVGVHGGASPSEMHVPLLCVEC